MGKFVCIIASSFEHAVDFIKWLEGNVKVDRAASRVLANSTQYIVIDIRIFHDPNKLLGFNPVECYILDEQSLFYEDIYHDTMSVINERRKHMCIHACNFYKKFDGYFGR